MSRENRLVKGEIEIISQSTTIPLEASQMEPEQFLAVRRVLLGCGDAVTVEREEFVLRRLGVLIFLCALSLGCVAAEPDARQSVEAGYSKIRRAVSLKYIDGIYSARARGFVGYTPDGSKVDLNLERSRYEQLFGEARSARETFKILSFKPGGSGRFICDVNQVIEIVVGNPSTKKLAQFVLDTTSRDEWISTAHGWKQKSSHVQKQTLRKTDFTPPK